ncbi:MAG: helix-turn-helix domain-containing protein [Chloroflexota bacterium]
MQDVLTVREVASLLRIGESTVHQLLRAGDLRGAKAGKNWRIARSAVEDFLRGPRAAAPSSERPRVVAGAGANNQIETAGARSCQSGR